MVVSGRLAAPAGRIRYVCVRISFSRLLLFVARRLNHCAVGVVPVRTFQTSFCRRRLRPDHGFEFSSGGPACLDLQPVQTSSVRLPGGVIGAGMFSCLRETAFAEVGDSYHGVLSHGSVAFLAGGSGRVVDFLTHDGHLRNFYPQGLCFVGAGCTGRLWDRLDPQSVCIPHTAATDFSCFDVSCPDGRPRYEYFFDRVDRRPVRFRSSEPDSPACKQGRVRKDRTKAPETFQERQEKEITCCRRTDQGACDHIQTRSRDSDPDCTDGRGALFQL